LYSAREYQISTAGVVDRNVLRTGAEKSKAPLQGRDAWKPAFDQDAHPAMMFRMLGEHLRSAHHCRSI